MYTRRLEQDKATCISEKKEDVIPSSLIRLDLSVHTVF